ncbi:hypothetical protein, partial [Cellulomonas sp. GbtcB1]|uniref:hypothetical protein n=1 Tax=Cellulomonas sp. GbtcB1 TaxID=2824746 RepID=UPI001C2F6C89
TRAGPRHVRRAGAWNSAHRDVDGAGQQEWEAEEGARVLRGALAALRRDGSFPHDGLTPRSPASAAEGAGRVPGLPR